MGNVIKTNRTELFVTSLPGIENNTGVDIKGVVNHAFDVFEKDEQKKDSPPNHHAPELPINKVGVFSYIFMTWLSPLIWRMYKLRGENVKQGNIWTCSGEERVEQNTKRVKDLWIAEVANHGSTKASFYKVWTRFILRRTLINVVAMLSVWGITSFLISAFLLKIILAYLEDPEDDLWHGIGLVVSVLVCQLIRTCTCNAAVVYAFQTATRFRTGMFGILYDKVLRLKFVNRASSEILNTVSVDSERLFATTWMLPVNLTMPLHLTIGIVYCYVLIGYWVTVTIATFVVIFICQVTLSKYMEKLRKQCLRFTDARIKYMSEIFSRMKFIKLYAWEEPFKRTIEGERRHEKKFLLKSGIIQGIVTSIVPLTPTIASVVTICVYTSAGNDLSISTAFAFIGITNFMKQITFFFALTARWYGEAVVGMKRIKAILLMDEHVTPSNNCVCRGNAVELEQATFSWEFEQNTAKRNPKEITNEHKDHTGILTGDIVLADITIDIRKEQLLGVCGAVGSGKSSLLSAILGRMQQLNGHLAVNGKVAYSAQQAWVFNGTLRQNIIFGQEFNENRYKDVIRCCGLEPDIQRFDFGDTTEIGEHGITLSGGQKQRVSLARAAYSNSDIYLLDDPMSALDTTVGKQVFHDCIKGFLKKKTVILITHQLQYMSLCDEVIVMENGNIAERGDHDGLLKQDGLYTAMYQTFVKTTVTPNQEKDSRTTSEDKFTDVLDSPNYYGKNRCIEENNKTGQLVQEEERAIGSVTFRTYKAFVEAAGGWLVAVIVVALYSLAAGSVVFSEWWLSMWLESGYLSESDGVSPLRGISENETHMRNSVSNTSEEVGETGLRRPESILSGLDGDSYLLGYVVSFVGIICMQVMAGCVGVKVAIRASGNLHTKCLNSVMKAPLSFFESNPAGRILNRFTKDLDEGDVYIPDHININLQNLCLIILTLGVSSYITPWLLLAIVPVLVCVYFVKKVMAVSMHNLKRLENVSRSPLISHVDLTLQGLPSITTFGQKRAFFQKLANYGSTSAMMSLLFQLSAFWASFRIDVLGACLHVMATLIFVLSKGIVTARSAGLALSLLGKTVHLVDFLVTFLNQLEAKFTSIERINEYSKCLDQESQQGVTPAPFAWPTQGAIEFRNVVMRYRPHLDPVLKSVSFVIGPREKVGVVGRTGAGKSSLAVCLFRLVESSNGAISVDGQDVSNLSLRCLRSRISIIPQDPVLFNGTIRYNIDPFSEYTEDDVWMALERVKMKQTILQSEEKLNMNVEDNGSNFSVGERQLICMARAVLRNNKILLLDEATAYIDTSTDAMIQETIRTCFVDCTVITIAHRLSTVLNNDKIIVIEAGQVVESASPESLLADNTSHLNRMLAAHTLED